MQKRIKFSGFCKKKIHKIKSTHLKKMEVVFVLREEWPDCRSARMPVAYERFQRSGGGGVGREGARVAFYDVVRLMYRCQGEWVLPTSGSDTSGIRGR